MNRLSGFVQKLIFKRESTKHWHKIFVPIRILFLVSLGLLISSCVTNSSTSTSAGEKAPQFTLKDFYGTEYSLSQFKGKVVFIDFWASWCPPCRAAAPKLEELYEEYKDKSDKVQIMGINLDQNKTQAEQFIQKENISYLILQGGQSSVSKEYKISGIPAFYLIDAEGTIVKRYVGFRPSYAQEWRDEINKLIQ